jgi:hypothetical protein
VWKGWDAQSPNEYNLFNIGVVILVAEAVQSQGEIYAKR